MLDKVLGNKTAEQMLLFLYHYGELHASLLAKMSGLSETPVKNQLNKFENAGLLVSREVGRSRVYTFNPKSPFTKPIKDLISIVYESIPLSEREIIFSRRLRPRRKGKKILLNNATT
jgi:DNA-binding transcriptional ArsR family regulator